MNTDDTMSRSGIAEGEQFGRRYFTDLNVRLLRKLEQLLVDPSGDDAAQKLRKVRAVERQLAVMRERAAEGGGA
jgi:hypothetical protein